MKSWVNVHCWRGHNHVNDLSTSVHWEQQSPAEWGSEGWQSLPPGSEFELSMSEWPVCTITSKCRFLLLDFHPETAPTETRYWDALTPPLTLCLIHTLRFQALLVADHSISICTPQSLTPTFMHMCLCVCPFFISVPPQGRVPDPSLSAHGTLVVQTCIYIPVSNGSAHSSSLWWFESYTHSGETILGLFIFSSTRDMQHDNYMYYIKHGVFMFCFVLIMKFS